MALDYLTIPGKFSCVILLSQAVLSVFATIATSVDVERLFSRGRLLLSHLRNRMSAQTTRALLCLGNWSRLKLVKDEDVMKVADLEDIPGKDDAELSEGWDHI